MMGEIINKTDGESLVRADVTTRIFYGIHKRWVLQIIEAKLNYFLIIIVVKIYLKSMNFEMYSSQNVLWWFISFVGENSSVIEMESSGYKQSGN